jgi:hypothetical protein
MVNKNLGTRNENLRFDKENTRMKYEIAKQTRERKVKCRLINHLQFLMTPSFDYERN